MTAPTANAYHSRYPAQIERNFLNSCVAHSLGNIQACRCALRRVEHTITLRDFLAYERALAYATRPNLRTAAKLRSAMLYCL